MWRCLADLGLPEYCYRVSNILEYGLRRERDGKKTCPLAGGHEYGDFLLQVLM